MKSDTIQVANLFAGDLRYVVPIFQRHYVWTKEDQWKPLWEDLKEKATERLEGRAPRFPHYLGAMVLDALQTTSARELPVIEVIDGQQRITTLQILLAVIRDIASATQAERVKKNAEACLVNDRTDKMKNIDVEVFKVWPTGADQKLFGALIMAGKRDNVRLAFREHFHRKRDRLKFETSRPKLLQAYVFFYDEIESWLYDTDEHDAPAAPDLVQQRLNELLDALLFDFNIVDIRLEKADNAQVIFETMNGRGMALTAADLIRNHIFMRSRAAGEDIDRLYSEQWIIFEGPFWSELQRQGRFKAPRLLFMFQHYLSAVTGREVTLHRLFAEYRKLTEDRASSDKHGTMATQIAEIKRYAYVYQQIVTGKGDGPLGSFAQRMKQWDISTTFAVLMFVSVSEAIEDEEKERIFDMIASYLIRRTVCVKTAKNYNRIFLSLLGNVRESLSAKAVHAYLSGLEGESSNWPTDAEFEKAWLERPAYGDLKAERIKSLLLQLEEVAAHKSKTEKASLDNNLSVEHVLPQRWRKHWLLDGVAVTESEWTHATLLLGMAEDMGGRTALISRRERLLHSFGNLTLVTPGMNSSLQHGPFETKRSALDQYSRLMTNKHFAKLKEWNEEAILKRGEEMFEVARQVWAR